MRWTKAIAAAILILCLAGQLSAADEEARLRQAGDLIRAGRAAEAVPIYRQLLEESPNNPALVMNLAIALFQAGDYKSAAEQCRRALALQPGWGNALLFLGASHLRLGEPDVAAGYLETAVHSQPDERNTRIMLAEALLQAGRAKDAIPHFARASELVSDNPRVWYGLWLSCASLVKQRLGQIESSGRESTYWHALAGDDHARRGRLGLAVREYRQALALQPELPGIHESIASVYERGGRKAWAEQELRKKPASPRAECEANDAACLFSASRFVEALAATPSLEPLAAAYWDVKACRGVQAQAAEKLAALPASANSHELAARELADRALYPEAAKRWREALELDPNNLDLMEGLALSLRHGRDHRAALAVIEQMLEKAPERPGVQYLYGDTLLALGRPAEARTALESAVQRESFQLEARASLGKAYLDLDQPAKALAHLEAALPLDEDGTIHYQLAVAYRGVGELERAKQMFEQYAVIREAAQQRQRALDEEIAISEP